MVIGYSIRDFRFGNKILRYSKNDSQILNGCSGNFNSSQTTLCELHRNYKPTGRNLTKIDIKSKEGSKVAQIRHFEDNGIGKSLQIDVCGNFRAQNNTKELGILRGHIFGGYEAFGEFSEKQIPKILKKAKQILKTLK